MKTYYYFMDNNGGCYIDGEAYSFADETDMMDWAEEEGYNVEEIEAPENYDFDTLSIAC